MIDVMKYCLCYNIIVHKVFIVFVCRPLDLDCGS